MESQRRYAFLLLLCIVGASSGIILYRVNTPIKAEIWLTSALDPTLRLSHQYPLIFNISPFSESKKDSTSSSNYIIQVDASRQYQPIHGFGAAMTDSSAWLLHETLNQTQYTHIMESIFDPEKGIGLSYLRIPLGASDCAREFFSYDDTAPDLSDFSISRDQKYLIPVLTYAKTLNPTLKLIGSPWSAPGWMKIGNNLSDSNTKGLIGGHLNPSMYSLYADYIVKVLSAYQQNNLSFDALTLQNEQFFVPAEYPGMYMNESNTQGFVKVLGPALISAGFSTKIFILDHNWEFADNVLDILSDSGASLYIDGIAWHGYGNAIPERQSEVHKDYPSKLQYFTEVSGLQAYQSFPHNLAWTFHNIMAGSLRNWASTVMLWNLALDINGGPHLTNYKGLRGILTIPQINGQLSGEITYEGEYYMLAHFSKFIDFGAVRIESTHFSNTLETVAFLNPDQSMVLVICNPTDQTQSAKLKLGTLQAQYDFPARSIISILI